MKKFIQPEMIKGSCPGEASCFWERARGFFSGREGRPAGFYEKAQQTQKGGDGNRLLQKIEKVDANEFVRGESREPYRIDRYKQGAASFANRSSSGFRRDDMTGNGREN